MSHIDESRLLAYLDGELPPGETAGVEAHLEGCGECRESLQAVRNRIRLFSNAADRLDVPVPSVAWQEVRARAGSGQAEAEVREDDAADLRRPGRAAPFLKAAAVLLVVTGVASAIPGSPVDEWIGAAVDRAASLFGGEEDAVEREIPADSEDPDSRSGVAVALVSGNVTITLADVPPGTEVRVRLTDDDHAIVEAAGARYRTGPGRIEAIGGAGDEIRVDIPRMAAGARVVVNGEPAVVLDAGGLRLVREPEARADSTVSFPVRSR